LDVSRALTRWGWALALGVVVALGFVLRLKGLHDPILDHPGWRQGDTAAIARNFATLDLNPFHPQTDYDGPPPNYVELELQIVPWLAALLYKLFGVHEVFGRLISIAFSLGTIVVVGTFARWMFASRTAGVTAALAFALYPGSVYYGRTFTPDTTMTFFLTAAVFAAARWIVDDEARPGRRFWLAAGLTALALLAKPVAIVGLVPIAAALLEWRGLRGALRSPWTYAFFILALAPYAAYDAYVRAIAEWHWASGITRLHVLPALGASFASFGALRHKLGLFRDTLRMLGTTMLGPVGLGSLAFGAIATTIWRTPSQSRALLWAWLGAALAYAYAVVTVERVDYYLYPFLPLAAVWTGGAAEAVRRVLPANARRGALAAGFVLGLAALVTGHAAVKPYYEYSKNVYRQAKALDATLAPGALVVMGHYDPSVLYYIGRKGWEEDPYVWTPFDEESAIRKGARYFIAIEPRRLRRNVELHAWLARFPLANANARWPVYETDPAKILSGAEERWKAFRRAESQGRGRSEAAGASGA
jgi:4-amino-4-deoxy-L-arabinose transferase-like glycosyltransferase